MEANHQFLVFWASWIQFLFNMIFSISLLSNARRRLFPRSDSRLCIYVPFWWILNDPFWFVWQLSFLRPGLYNNACLRVEPRGTRMSAWTSSAFWISNLLYLVLMGFPCWGTQSLWTSWVLQLDTYIFLGRCISPNQPGGIRGIWKHIYLKAIFDTQMKIRIIIHYLKSGQEACLGWGPAPRRLKQQCQEQDPARKDSSDTHHWDSFYPLCCKSVDTFDSSTRILTQKHFMKWHTDFTQKTFPAVHQWFLTTLVLNVCSPQSQKNWSNKYPVTS